MLPLFFVDGVDDLGQTEKLNPDKLDSFVTVRINQFKHKSVLTLEVRMQLPIWNYH